MEEKYSISPSVKNLISAAEGNGQKSLSSKAANRLLDPAGANRCLARGAYLQYVSTAKGRERRWRLFSTFPQMEDENGGIETRSPRLNLPDD